jgi:hypothetical protein
LAIPVPVQGGECYFLIVFGAQRVPNDPRYSHSFAAFIRATCEGPCADNYILEHHTISWLPETMEIRLLRLRPERGHNFDLTTTLDTLLAMGDRVSMWGPYQIDQELYDRAMDQIGRLESGAVEYKAVDGLHQTSRVSNCIHAVAGVLDDQRRLRVASPGFGQSASYHIARRFEPWMIEPEQTHPWLARLLGLDQYPVILRDLGPSEPARHMARLIRPRR